MPREEAHGRCRRSNEVAQKHVTDGLKACDSPAGEEAVADARTTVQKISQVFAAAFRRVHETSVVV